MSYLCIDCGVESEFLHEVMDVTYVPYGSTNVAMWSVDREVCPQCGSENVRDVHSLSTSLPE